MPQHRFASIHVVGTNGKSSVTEMTAALLEAHGRSAGVYISPHACKRGLGSGLYDALLDELQRRGFRSAVAGITLPNDASIALHKKHGFERVGVFADAGWKLGAWHAVEWWQKRFATGPEGPSQ